MGKKSMKIPKHEKKQQIHSLIKILRPKVYITDSSNFKTLVQQLTGNGTSPISSPTPCVSAHASLLPFVDDGYQENSLDLSFDSSCFSEGSPDHLIRVPPPDRDDQYSFNYVMESQNINDLSSQYMDLESLLMGMDDSMSYNCETYNYGMIQQEVCTYDYGLSGII